MSFPSQQELQEFEPRYFRVDPEDRRKWTEHRCLYRMATWVFDQPSSRKALKRIEDRFGKELADKVKKYYDEENHDT